MNRSVKMVLIYGLALTLWAGCATIEPIQTREVAVKFVCVVKQWRMKGGEYRQYDYYLYEDANRTQYTLERNLGPIAIINIQK